MKTQQSLLAILTASLLAMSLVGCGSSSSSSSNSKKADTEEEARTVSTDEADEEEEPKEANVAVTIDDAKLGQDYDGNPVAIITYTFTNVSSDEAESFMASCHSEVYQDGVQCDLAFVTGLEGDSMTKVKAGKSTTFQQAYSINGTGEIEVEVKELFSWNDVVLASAKFKFE